MTDIFLRAGHVLAENKCVVAGLVVYLIVNLTRYQTPAKKPTASLHIVEKGAQEMERGTGTEGLKGTGKALNVAYSWSLGWGLDVHFPEAGEAGDLVVEGRSVLVGPRDKQGSGLLALDPDKLNSRNVDETLHEMWRLTLLCGKGTPAGFRKTSGTLRARSDDYEATSMRLTPFERIANPPEWLLKKYQPVVKREADCAARRYSEILRLMRMDVGDLWTVGMLYLCVYLHRHQDLRNDKKNGANLTLFLRQEFRRWASVTCEHLKNITFGSAGVPVSEVVGSPVPGVDFRDAVGKTEASYVFEPEHYEPEPAEPRFASEEESARYERRVAMQEGRFRKARQRAHAAELEDRLSTLSHDQYVEAMSNVMNEERHPVEAREEAARRMDLHMKECEPCRVAAAAWTVREAEERRLRVSARRSRKGQDVRVPTIDDDVESPAEAPADAEAATG
jgi:hypothetical protein